VEGLGWKRGLSSGDDENFLKLEEVDGRLDEDGGVGLVVGIGRDGFHGADGEAAGEDLIAAGCEDRLAWLDAVVGGEIADLDATTGGAVDDGADAGRGEDDAGAGGLVVDEQHLCGVGRGLGEDVANLADDAEGGDDGHVGLEAVGGTLIDIEDAGEVGAAGADDLRGEGGRDVVLLEGEKGL